MKKISMILGLALTLVFAACEKENVTPAEVKSMSEDKAVFENTTQEESDELNAMLNGEIAFESQQINGKSNTVQSCCVISSLTYQPLSSTPPKPNLNVQFQVESTTQQLVIKHWRKTGSIYTYLGQTSSSNFPACTPMDINIGAQYFTPSGDYISWARIEDGSSFCGNAGFLQWSH